MAVDIAPELYKKISDLFQEKYEKAQLLGSPISEMRKKLEAGTATFRDADMYAVEVGSMLSEAMKEVLQLDELPNGQLYYNIAQRTVGTAIQDTYGLVSSVAAEVQEELNAANNIGLKAITPAVDPDRLNGMVNLAAAAEDQETLNKALTSPVENILMSAVDDTVKANAEFQSKAGLQPIIRRRTTGKCCDWCSALAGTYKYPHDVPKDVYRRHQNCRCTVEYVDVEKRQDVWSKREDVLSRYEAKSIEDEALEQNKRQRYTIKNNEFRAYANNIRNDQPLTKAQIKECIDYAVYLGMPRKAIQYSENQPTGYGAFFDWLIIGTDVYPRSGGSLSANGKMSYRAALAHEIIGHRETTIKGTAKIPGSALDEAQASFRAARFSTDLSNIDRYLLIRDGIDRLHNAGLYLKQIKHELDIYIR